MKTKSVKTAKIKLQGTAKLGVDAANICALDEMYILENGGQVWVKEGIAIRIPVEPGLYSVSLKIDDCWDGKVSDIGLVLVRGAAILIGDACYQWSSGSVDHGVWTAFLDKTDYMQEMDGRGFQLRTGGDGEFEVVYDVKKAPHP